MPWIPGDRTSISKEEKEEKQKNVKRGTKHARQNFHLAGACWRMLAHVSMSYVTRPAGALSLIPASMTRHDQSSIKAEMTAEFFAASKTANLVWRLSLRGKSIVSSGNSCMISTDVHALQ